MLTKMKYIMFLCFSYWIIVAEFHVEGKHSSGCSNFDSVLGVMEETARLRVELEELKKTFEQEIAEQRKTIAFCASELSVHPAKDESLKYDNVDYNIGSMYYPSSGTVVIKETGFYTLHVQFCAAFTKAAVVGLKVNDVLLRTSTIYEDKLGSCSTLVFSSCLEVGDTVVVVNAYKWSEFLEDSIRSNYFCGYRVNKQICENQD